MSTDFSVSQTWMEHKGGSKFYQVFEFRPKTGNAMTVVHFGKVTHTIVTFSRPIIGGQVVTHKGALGRAKVEAKLGRGYEVVDTLTTLSSVKGSSFLVETFGASIGHDLGVAMFGHSMGSETPPTDHPDNEVIAEQTTPAIQDRPAHWGRW